MVVWSGRVATSFLNHYFLVFRSRPLHKSFLARSWTGGLELSCCKRSFEPVLFGNSEPASPQAFFSSVLEWLAGAVVSRTVFGRIISWLFEVDFFAFFVPLRHLGHWGRADYVAALFGQIWGLHALILRRSTPRCVGGETPDAARCAMPQNQGAQTPNLAKKRGNKREPPGSGGSLCEPYRIEGVVEAS